MRPVLRFLGVTLKHKWWVAVAARRVGGVGLWRVLAHDLSKLRPSELFPYARQYYGDKGDRPAYERAWRLHVARNDHHWQHWQGDLSQFPGHGWRPRKMPEAAVREMVADWCAASRAYGGRWPWEQPAWAWFTLNREQMRLHADTWHLVLDLVNEQVMTTPRRAGSRRTFSA